MSDDPFDNLESTLRSGGPEAGFDLLIGKFREEKKYPLVFEARLMKSRHALGLPLNLQSSHAAAGVMMIPVPATGVLQAVDGVEAARATPGISGIEITATMGQIIAPPPEGASYLGFMFSRADTPENAEAALRAAHAQLTVHIQPLI